ncbi:flavin monoamine oxidase family protein [Burkholderia stabilis]|uniref:flavin monoamine oxidase family protein n=1 Tax=Burkholderia stabilis TaxID=95485 RepID=UPI001428CD7C|nr:NAD(P)/FAD-dependent oxidoreductase [Burkholderia stabilis]HDR9494402.1 FAD-dependent oxidoreductase [Burkholderia stabilis]HDR9525386.1 FAD-dependent oxidoreductase [Burkholderia stabilis]HDR9528419.1 FAD-dependent oxidoreductase [Burkholderia stabilis]HDR9541828.1 FAD-dependent oxidoreductase [Burkholderia stabilis]HDR9543417.1 FAD-dependent oxidoreductase [Burkholderia stabilis]
MTEDQSPGVTRRTFLRGAGSALAASALAGTAMAHGLMDAPGNAVPAGPESKKVASGARYDVIVIGGGFAGLTAARDCALRGMKTLLLEARSRVGGRTFTSSYEDHRLELGGTWIHWTQPNVWNEVSRYGLGLVESAGASPDRLTWRSGARVFNGDVAKAFPILADAMAKFCDVDGMGGRSVFPRPYDASFNEQGVRKFAGMSLKDRLDALKFAPEADGLISAQLTTLCNRDPASGAFVEHLRLMSLVNYDMGLLFDCSRYKIEQGMSGLAHSIIADGRADVMLSAPVAKVERQQTKVIVTTTAGAQYSAGSVICTVPVNVLKTIEFSPPLDPRKLQVSKAGVAGQGAKCYVHIRQKIGKWMGCGAFPNPITMTWTEQERDDGTLLVAFGPPGLLDINDEQAVQKALRTILPGVDVVATTGYQWTADPYSQGTWCFYHPGQMENALTPLRTREGAIFFASADSALGWRGFIDGAIESGTRTAQEVHAFLDQG